MAQSHHRVLVVAIVASGLLLSACVDASTEAERRAQLAVEEWLEALIDRDASVAWDAIAADTQQTSYMGDESAFIADVAAADWTGLQWSIDGEPAWRDVVWIVNVSVEGGLETVPDFLFERALIQQWNVDGYDRGLIVEVVTQWPWGMRIYSPISPEP
jgi:hypothetical protein